MTEVLAIIQEETDLEIRIDRRPGRPGDVHEVILDTTLLRSLIHWDPVPLREGVTQTWERLNARSLSRIRTD